MAFKSSHNISKKDYQKIHHWVRYHHGKAMMCTNKECLGMSKTFQWALLRGKKYAKRIENFAQMCAPCHHKYDFTELARKLMKEASRNAKKTHCPQGHEYTKENVMIIIRKRGNKTRYCRKCCDIKRTAWSRKSREHRRIYQIEYRKRVGYPPYVYKKRRPNTKIK